VTVHPDLRRLAVRAYLKRLTMDDRPIVVGPWRSEVGFEGLYWLPFLHWCAKQVPNFWQRATILTRGGSACLYPGPHAVDLYTLRTVTQVRRENLSDWLGTKLQKQTQVTPWDRTVAREAVNGQAHHLLHPAWMYWALAPFWDEARGLKYLLSMADYSLLPRPSIGTLEGLPEKYVAVKFYGRSTFPWPHPHTAQFVSEVAGTIAKQIPVVLLNSGHQGDEHGDIDVSGPNIYRLPSAPPEANLAMQAMVLGKATAFVGTYGGVSQLALRMGVPSVSFYGEWGGTAHAHLGLSSWLSKMSRVPFLAASMEDCGLWRQTLPSLLLEKST
jgi:hypothetical protein